MQAIAICLSGRVAKPRQQQGATLQILRQLQIRILRNPSLQPGIGGSLVSGTMWASCYSGATRCQRKRHHASQLRNLSPRIHRPNPPPSTPTRKPGSKPPSINSNSKPCSVASEGKRETVYPFATASAHSGPSTGQHSIVNHRNTSSNDSGRGDALARFCSRQKWEAERSRQETPSEHATDISANRLVLAKPRRRNSTARETDPSLRTSN